MTDATDLLERPASRWSWWKARTLFLPTLAWNVLLGRVFRVRHWYDRITPDVWLGALPFPRDVSRLAELGINSVVNTCEEYAGPQSRYCELGIEQLRIPTVDFTHPHLSAVDQAVDFMQTRIAGGGKVYVHCKAGRGRSATVVACWLIATQGLDRRQAQALLTQRRPHVNRHLEERPVVIEFERRLRQRNRVCT